MLSGTCPMRSDVNAGEHVTLLLAVALTVVLAVVLAVAVAVVLA